MQTALSAAQDAFWAKGYKATSARELTQAMGLTQPSLYNAFGDKRTLFLQALEGYLNHTLRERIARVGKLVLPLALSFWPDGRRHHGARGYCDPAAYSAGPAGIH